jgi:hypothetical protein
VPILRLRVKHTGIQLVTSFGRFSAFFYRVLNLPYDAKKVKWSSYVSEAVKELWTKHYAGSEDPFYHIIIKSLCAEWWMGWDATNSGTGHPVELTDWFERSGCPEVYSLIASGPQ